MFIQKLPLQEYGISSESLHDKTNTMPSQLAYGLGSLSANQWNALQIENTRWELLYIQFSR